MHADDLQRLVDHLVVRVSNTPGCHIFVVSTSIRERVGRERTEERGRERGRM